MCDYFYQRMENSQGDLTDIIRSRSLVGEITPTELPNSWQFLPEPTAAFPLRFDEKVYRDAADPETSFFEASGSLFKRKPLEKGKGPAVIVPAVTLTAHGGGGPVEISSPRLVSGIKRRKSQAKKVVCIPAPAAASGRPSGEVVPSDLWAWRKYGQKPIKGSPYPRGYYRCSSSKGCSARKQVERSRTDPTMLVITYTSEHNHPWPTQRNALAGSTRSHPSKSNNNASSSLKFTNIKEESKDCSSSNTPPLIKEDNHDFQTLFDESYNEHTVSNLNQADNFFADLAEFDPNPMSLIFPNKNNMFDWGEGNMFGETKRGL